MHDVQIAVYLKDYLPLLGVSLISYLLVNELYIFKNDELIKYSSFRIFTESVKTAVFTMAFLVVALNFLKANYRYSRIFEGIFAILLALMIFILRSLTKKILVNYLQKTGAVEKILIVATAENVSDVIQKSVKDYDWRNRVVGVLLDAEELPEGKIDLAGYQLLGSTEQIDTALLNVDYDSVLLAVESNRQEKRKWISYFQDLGKVIHVYIREYDYYDSYKNLDSIGDMAVVSYRAVSPVPKRQLILKRIIDLVLAFLLLPLYLLLYLLVLLFTSLESPGKVILPRVRVGKNNIRYYQYRFRVYRLDARERLRQGLSPFTGIGKFLRMTHLDGAPMILNILGGDMSFVGPKAPNLTKWMRMNKMERNALSMKPGVMGYWSIRSQLDVIREEDQKYITGWNILRDFSIFVLMVFRYLTHQSLRIDGDTHIEEELAFCDELNSEERSVEYRRDLYEKKQPLLFRFIKRSFDIVVSGVALILLGIPMILIALLITIDDGGNPIYKHRRVGKDGKYIDIYKFRSMVLNAGDLESLLNEEQLEQYRREFKVDNDPRITKIGNFIRKSSIDELPQLINILKGDLSIIGPRPLLKEELFENYTDEEVAKFLSVMPGLTGYWQAYARNNATYETGERQKMEMYYVDHQSLWLDIKIFFKTFTSVLMREGVK